jgi:hypothetical protein
LFIDKEIGIKSSGTIDPIFRNEAKGGIGVR